MAEEADQITIIGRDTVIKGELTFTRQTRVLGRFEGKIVGEGDLEIAEGATCQADVEANSVTIDGNLEGNSVIAKEIVRLSETGVIRGDVTAAKMTMAEGASFFGNIAIGPEAMRDANRSTQDDRRFTMSPDSDMEESTESITPQN